MKIKRNVLLKSYTTFQIGGQAKYFFKAKTKKDLIEILKWARQKGLPFFILGGGSNILFSDKGFDGLVVKIQITKTKNENFKIYTEAGTKLKNLVKLCLKNNLADLEWAAGIPGTIGGAISGNAGAFGVFMSNLVEKVEVLDIEADPFTIKTLDKNQCCFSLKNSIFKKNKNLIILSAFLKLEKGDKKEIRKKIHKHLTYRKQTHPLQYASAGCVFSNKDNGRGDNGGEGKTMPSSYLIDKAGLKGRRIGNAQVSQKHANFIVNLGKAKSNDVLGLIDLIKKEVEKKCGVQLKEEIEVIKY